MDGEKGENEDALTRCGKMVTVL